LRAKVLSSLGKSAEAKSILQDSLAAEPEDPEAHHALGSHILQSGDVGKALSLLLEARRLDPLGHNDRDTIASAYGQLLWPFRQIAPYLVRIDRFSRRKRWLLWSVIGSMLLLVKFLLPTKQEHPPIPVLILFVGFANLLALPISVDVLTTALGKLAARKRLNVAWYMLVPEVIRPLFVVILQALATGIGLGCAYAPPGLLIILMAIAMNFDLFLVVARSNELDRRVAILIWGSVILTAALSAAFVEQDQLQGLAVVWMIIIAISFVTTFWQP
jgi:hypothetical protein